MELSFEAWASILGGLGGQGLPNILLRGQYIIYIYYYATWHTAANNVIAKKRGKRHTIDMSVKNC